MQPGNGWQGSSHQPSRKPSAQNARQAMQKLPCTWIYWAKLKANYFPTSLNICGPPSTQHSQSYAMSWKPAMASYGIWIWLKSERCHTSVGWGLLPPMHAHSAPLEVSGSHRLGGCRHRDMVKSYIDNTMKLADWSSRQSQGENVATM